MRKVDLFILLLLVVNSLFIVANIALAQNYSVSLITNSEGIGISNSIASFLIAEDGWSVESFKQVYHSSAILVILTSLLTFILIIYRFATSRK
ncbi:hypothetical protein J45TS6_28020 [Paenibacillus sp. J45TS6]|uniref:hypothetical protein n=1 Tax=unclassified Paenibacillus TaxID=185978 RepID=UPI001B15E8B5|nr:hypothetical protein [Paenibacillus sp. J45TS6]GIP44343.1 hypothetical protein J45TS6_28020 [Paenibacillus sp. J45TS6]